MSFARQRVLELGQPALFEQRVVAVDLGDEALLRRDRVDLRRRQAEQRRRRRDLAIDLGGDRRRGLELVPQAVDLVEDHEPPGLLRGVVAGKMAIPHVEVGLRHAGVGGQHEQDGVRVRQEVQRELRLGADRVQSRRVEDDEALLQQRMREVDDRVAPARDLDLAVRVRAAAA